MQRLMGGVIELFQIVTGLENLDYFIFCTLSQSQCHRHQHKLLKVRAKLDIGTLFFQFVFLICCDRIQL